MPAYTKSPFGIKSALLSQTPGFSFGGLDSHNPGTRMSIQQVAIATNVATLNVTILEGPIPKVNTKAVQTLISVQGTQTVTSGGGNNFNVTNAAVTAVSIDYITGIGTISYALTSSNIAATPDSGIALVPAPLTMEALGGTSGAGQSFGLDKPQMAGLNNVRMEVGFSGAPGAFTLDVQGADYDLDGNYVNITGLEVTTVNTGNVAYLDCQILSRFIRPNFTAFANNATVNTYVRFTQV